MFRNLLPVSWFLIRIPELFFWVRRFIFWSWPGFVLRYWWLWWLRLQTCFWQSIGVHCTFFPVLRILLLSYGCWFPNGEFIIVFVWEWCWSFRFLGLSFSIDFRIQSVFCYCSQNQSSSFLVIRFSVGYCELRFHNW